MIESINDPHFIVRLYNAPGNIVAEECLIVDEINPIFLSTGSNLGDLLYTNWKCGTLIPDPEQTEIGDVLMIEFIMTDDGKGFSFATVYIDDICNETSQCSDCEYCIDVNADVLSPDYDQQQAEMCIEAVNVVNNGAMASYHAGEEVLLKPDFESLYGSTGHYYIEACSGDYNLRQAILQDKEEPAQGSVNGLKIYPNPTNGILNIAGDVAINAVRLTSLEGKNIQVNQHSDNENYKLDMSSVSQGIYLLTIEKKNGGMVTQKIVKH